MNKSVRNIFFQVGICMTNEDKEKCQYIIHGSAAAAAAIGFIPLPGADLAPICAVQSAMIIALSRVFKVAITDETARQMAKTFIVGNIGKMLVSQFSKLVPILGGGVNATVAAGLTEALGWEVVEEFDKKNLNKQYKLIE